MRPLVAHVTKLANEAALRRAEHLAEYVVPLVPKRCQKAGDVPYGFIRVAKELNLGCAKRPLRFSEPFVLVIALEFALDKRLQADCQLFEALSDAFVICDGHKLFLIELGFPLAQDSHHSVKFR